MEHGHAGKGLPVMADDTDLMQLYSGRILALAAAIPHTGRLPAPDGSASRRSPLCGSIVTVDVTLAEGRIAAFGQDVRACALGQASASVLGAHVIGLGRDDLAQVRDALEAMLKRGGAAPAGDFADLEVLAAARDYRNRHASILLAWDATLAAIEAAEG